MLFWGLLAEAADTFRALPNADAVGAALQGTPTGTYFLPWPRSTPAQFDAFVAAHQRGGFFELHDVAEGVDPNSPGKLLLGTLHHAVVAALAALLVHVAAPPTATRAATLVFVAGSLGTIFITLGDPIWFHLPWHHAAARTAYELGAWAVLAAVAAWANRVRTAG